MFGVLLSSADQAAQQAANATTDLAHFTIVLLLLNLLLFLATAYYAKAAKDGVKLQKEELKVVEKQLRLTRRQLDELITVNTEAREIAAPKLLLTPDSNEGPEAVQFGGLVEYVGGTAPADEVQVLFRHFQNNLWFYASLDVVSLQQPRLRYRATAGGAAQIDGFGAQIAVEAGLLSDDYLAVSWQDQAGQLRWWGTLMHRTDDGRYIAQGTPRRGVVYKTGPDVTTGHEDRD